MDAVGILVGEGPGREEAEQGRPFVGPTGQQLNTELLSVGLRRSQLYILNATACVPPAGVKAEKTMQRAVKACRPFFMWQLRHFDTRTHTLAMGKWAAFAILNRTKGVMKARGFIREAHLPRVWSTKGKESWLQPDKKKPSDSKQRSTRSKTKRGGKKR